MKCRDVKLHDFVLGLTEKDYSWISQDQVMGAEMFATLHDEYNTLVNSTQHAYILSILNELAALKSRYIAVEAALLVLQDNYDIECAEIIRSMGYQFDPDKYLESITGVYRKLKATRLNIDRKIKEYEAEQAKYKGSEQTYQDFVRILAILSTSLGVTLQIKEITVAEFAAYYNLHLEKMKANAR